MCHRNPPRTTLHESSGHLHNFRPDCRCWHCSECRPKLIAEYLGKLQSFIDTSGGAWVVRGSAADWRRFRKRAWRQVNWFRVQRPDGGLTCYCDGPMGEGCRLSTERCVADASRILEEETPLQGGKRFLRVSVSKAWRSPRKISEWTDLGIHVAASFRREVIALGGRILERVRGGVRYLRAKLSPATLVEFCRKHGYIVSAYSPVSVPTQDGPNFCPSG